MPRKTRTQLRGQKNMDRIKVSVNLFEIETLRRNQY